MFTIELVPNTSCNLACHFCFASRKINNHTTKAEIKKAFDAAVGICKIKKEKNIFIKIYGGESLLVMENVLYAIDLGNIMMESDSELLVTCGIITNGTIYDERLVSKIKNSKMPTNITISMEGNKKAHDAVRHFHNGSGSYDIVIENIKKYNIALNKKRMNIQTVMSPSLLENIEDYISFMENNKAFCHFNIVPMFDSTFENVDLTIIKNMKSLFDYYIDQFKSGDPHHVGTFQPGRCIITQFNNAGFQHNQSHHCHAGHGQLTVVPGGDLVPCSMMFHNNQNEYLKYGNSESETEEVVTKYFEKINMMKHLTSHSFDCKKCQNDNGFGCLGVCASHNLKDNNRLFNSVCEYNKEFGKQSIRMVRELKSNQFFLNSISYEVKRQVSPSFYLKYLTFIEGV
ncbi:MAG: radical SAM protein [Fusobacteriaceae bacterium]